MRHNFPDLNTLILSDCDLRSQDLCSLAQASVKDRLPKLKHLNISHNRQIAGNSQMLFDNDCKWNLLTHLDVEQLETEDVDSDFQDLGFLTSKVGFGSLPSLQNLRVSLYGDNQEMFSNRVSWKELRRLNLACVEMNDVTIFLRSVANAGEEDLYPKLETVCFVKRSESLSVDLKVVQRLRQRNISVFSVDSQCERRQKDLDIVNDNTTNDERQDETSFFLIYGSFAVVLLAVAGIHGSVVVALFVVAVICLGLYVLKCVLNKRRGT